MSSYRACTFLVFTAHVTIIQSVATSLICLISDIDIRVIAGFPVGVRTSGLYPDNI